MPQREKSCVATYENEEVYEKVRSAVIMAWGFWEHTELSDESSLFLGLCGGAEEEFCLDKLWPRM